MSTVDEIAELIREEVPANALPDEDTSGLFRLYAELLLSKGNEVSNVDVHGAWVTWMRQLGRKHESMVPYEDLPESVKREDLPYTLAIRSIAKRLSKN